MATRQLKVSAAVERSEEIVVEATMASVDELGNVKLADGIDARTTVLIVKAGEWRSVRRLSDDAPESQTTGRRS